MNQIKTGKFIQEKRKQKNLTQKELAEKLNISDKTISKWETGNGLPEVGLMVPLCEILGVSVNELLCGETLQEKEYYQKAEENMLNLILEKNQSKKKIFIQAIIFAIVLIAYMTIIMMVAFLDMSNVLRGVLISVAVLIMILEIIVGCVIDRETGVYECRYCGNRFTPSMREYVMGAHTITTRRLKCPKCGKVSFCKKRLSK